MIQATISLGRLISTSMLPNSDSIERRLVLEASSSMSPWRGSMSSGGAAVARFVLLDCRLFDAMRLLPLERGEVYAVFP